MKPDEFKALRDAVIADKYNTDEIRYRILNGDGAVWIAKGHDTEGSLLQLDPYHFAKSVVRNVYDKNSRRHIKKYIARLQ